MNLYLSNIIIRLKDFSQSLDKKELFVDKPWVIVDANYNQQKYIFKRDGELIMSFNGQVKVGNWEYIASANSIMIDRIADKVLLNQSFVDSAVMALRMDGTQGNTLILANEHLIPDLDVISYLKKLFHEKHNIQTVELKNGNTLEIFNYNGLLYLNRVTIEGANVKDGKYEVLNQNSKLKIEGSKIIGLLVDKTFSTKQGMITVECEGEQSPKKGNLVILNNRPAPNDDYKIGIFRKISVRNGIIV